MRIDNPTGSIASLTGSFTGSFYGDGLGLINIESASYAETASYAASASYAVSSSHEIVTEVSSSYAETATSSSYALTASFALNGGGGGSADYSPYQTGSVSSGILPKEGINCCVIGNFSTIAGGCRNIVENNSTQAFIGSGAFNTINEGDCAAIIGGCKNRIDANLSFIGGGCSHSGSAYASSIVGGAGNKIGGGFNCFSEQYGTIVGGISNCITGGALSNQSVSYSSMIGGGSNTICNSTTSISTRTLIAGGQNNTLDGGNNSFIIGGYLNTITEVNRGGILGGSSNVLTHNCSFIIGNGLTSDKICYTFMNNADVAGTVSASIFSGSFVGDGSGLTGISGGGGGSDYSPYQTGSSVFPSNTTGIYPKLGSNCESIGDYSAIVGGCNNQIHASSGDRSFIGGGSENLVCSLLASILGGCSNLIETNAGYASIGGGRENEVGYNGGSSFIGNGYRNIVSSSASIIGSGTCNIIDDGSQPSSGILGGCQNSICASPFVSYTQGTNIIGGGRSNAICNSCCSAILGGTSNTITSNNCTFIIGANLTADKACYTFMNNLDVESTVSASVFSGSFVGDGSGLTGVSGGGGGTIYNSTVRYVAYNSTQLVEILSTGTMYSGLSWSRSGTTITITSTAHGLSNGDYVVVRNMGDTDYVYGAISSVTTDSFQITNAVSSGDTSGTSGAYIPAADATSVTDDGATIGSPTVGDIQIISIKVHFGAAKTGNTFDLTMPTSLTNGAGGNTSNATMNPPIVGVWNLSTGAFNASGLVSVWGGTGSAGSYNVFQVGGINQLVDGMIKFTF